MGRLEIITSNLSQLVDAKEVARHLGFDVTLIRKMAREGKIPAVIVKNGSRSYSRFRLKAVEEALKNEYQTSVVPEGDAGSHPTQKGA